ncbi:hypothetical protein BDP27DRAFT_1335195 [Rhodocollybia butyracea]|uniref:Uncharacterized protein n=1 Tax=Rhodocollybia butyracea TaxID=206335 RepID=A0A9P5PGG0_9AGAR|nr:hypothetical protein BDP27DRAFT_1335195 [Rhodocollybia butyracea]
MCYMNHDAHDRKTRSSLLFLVRRCPPDKPCAIGNPRNILKDTSTTLVPDVKSGNALSKNSSG